MDRKTNRSWLAFGTGFPVALLGGLIGLGGAEFRLPILVALFGFGAKTAVPINLAVSLITVIAAFLTRLSVTSNDSLFSILPDVLTITAASMTGAWLGAAYLHRTREHVLERTIQVLLVLIAILLFYESFFSFTSGRLAQGLPWNVFLGILFGSGIGIVSALLGVAGGELIIPTLILVFGVDIKLAGTASLLISIPTIPVGMVRYGRQGYYRDRTTLRQVVLPMGAGSIFGALTGGIMVHYVSGTWLKRILGTILFASALKIFGGRNQQTRSAPQGGNSA
ncbi:MAG TPA: sulfite exporter TauE/SafE family protein [Nitrospiria bacterium]|nr:sulfite exporter TauE/SafE family protein [Nitrospiria bacterium]